MWRIEWHVRFEMSSAFIEESAQLWYDFKDARLGMNR